MKLFTSSILLVLLFTVQGVFAQEAPKPPQNNNSFVYYQTVPVRHYGWAPVRGFLRRLATPAPKVFYPVLVKPAVVRPITMYYAVPGYTVSPR